jgi:hypothetical protein
VKPRLLLVRLVRAYLRRWLHRVLEPARQKLADRLARPGDEDTLLTFLMGPSQRCFCLVLCLEIAEQLALSVGRVNERANFSPRLIEED